MQAEVVRPLDWKVIVNGQQRLTALRNKGYLQPRSSNALLPYWPALEKWIEEYINHLEMGIVTAVLVEDRLPGLNDYIVHLIKLFNHVGLVITKDQAIRLIKLVYFIMTKEGQSKEVTFSSANLLHMLTDNTYLTWRDLVLDWKPIFALYKGLVTDKIRQLSGFSPSNIHPTLIAIKRFYDPAEIANIWSELEIYISPRGKTMHYFTAFCVHFLPDRLTGQEQHLFGAVYWWKTVWQLYKVVEQNGCWGQNLPKLFASVAHFAPDFIDLSSEYDFIFTSILHSLKLATLKGSVSIDGEQEEIDIKDFGVWVGSLLGGPASCQPHLARLMDCIVHFLHPTNNGEHKELILDFMLSLTNHVAERVYRERIKRHKHPVPTQFYLTDQDLKQFVEVLIQPALVALFNEDTDEMCMARAIIRNLASINPEEALPRFLEHTYDSLHAISEPQRLNHLLSCLVSVVYHITADNEEKMRTNFVQDFAGEINKMRKVLGKELPLSENEKKFLTTNQANLTLRIHLIHLMETLIAAVNVNDVKNSDFALRNIVLIYSLIPNIDASPCLNIYANQLTEDEKELCRLTSRLPRLAEELFDKIFQAIECFGCCLTRDGDHAYQGLNFAEGEVGSQEVAFMKTVNKVVAIVMCSSSEPIANLIANKILEFCSNIEFESQVATTMTVQLIEETVYSRPNTISRFIDLIFTKLRELLTDEMKQSRVLSKTALFFINLAGGLFSATSETFIENKEVLIEILDMLINCECKTAQDVGAKALNSALYMLTKTYTLSADRMQEKINRPLTEWIPIREWAQLVPLHEMKPVWHVAGKSRRAEAEELIKQFVFPILPKLDSALTTKVDRRRYLFLLTQAFKGAYNCFAMPQIALRTETDLPPTVIPTPKYGISKIPLSYWDHQWQQTNLRSVIVNKIEEMITWMEVNNAKEDLECLSLASELLKIIICDSALEDSQVSYLEKHVDDYCTYMRGTIDKKRFREYAIDTIISYNHNKILSYIQMPIYTSFHKNIFGLLFTLSIHHYPKVRASAIDAVKELMETFPSAKRRMIELIAQKLNDPRITDDQMMGVVHLIKCNKWLRIGPGYERYQLWPALAQMRMPEHGELIGLFDQLLEQLNEEVTAPKILSPPVHEAGVLEAFCYTEWQRLLPRATRRWAKFKRVQQFEVSTLEKKERQRAIDHYDSQLVDFLLQAVQQRDLHHSRYKLTRAMLWLCQGAKANQETIRHLLEKLLDRDDKETRNKCVHELFAYLKYNKPQVRRRTIACPVRPIPPNTDNGLMSCGLRKDNLFMAYDSENLPNTQEKWNETLFCSKAYGCYKWPATIQVRVSAAENIFDLNRVYTQQEQVIASWFDNEENVCNWLNLCRQDKRDDKPPNYNVINLIKYVLRNFPNHRRHIYAIRGYLAYLFNVDTRESHRLAAEMFMGIARGTRHRPWTELDDLWQWLKVEVDLILYKLTSDADWIWSHVLQMLRNGDDSRRFYWLIEQLLTGWKRQLLPVQLRLRSDLIPANRWRDASILIRMNECAWNKLDRVTMEIESLFIAENIIFTANASDQNLLNNEFVSLPMRFRLPGPKNWMNRFVNKINQLNQNVEEAARAPAKRARTGGAQGEEEEANQPAGEERARSPKRARLAEEEEEPGLSASRANQEEPGPSTSRVNQEETGPPPTKRARADDENEEENEGEEETQAPPQQQQLVPLAAINENEKRSSIYLLTLLYYLGQYFDNTVCSMTPMIIKLFPLVIKNAIEEKKEDVLITKNEKSIKIAHTFMATCLLSESLTDQMLTTVCETYNQPNLSWKVRVSILKYLQVLIFSNVFVFERGSRPLVVVELIFSALVDLKPEVRQEAANAFQALAMIKYIRTSEELIRRLRDLLNTDKHNLVHGGIHGLAAIVLAHPYETPAEIVPAIELLCRVPTKFGVLRETARKALREFRRMQNVWKKTAKIIGERLVDHIESQIAPSYSA